jgi:hypothetical protein
MTPTKLSGLEAVQNLYVLQVALAQFLAGEDRSRDDIASVRRQLQEFSQLLKAADWQYMGGEDVYQSLQEIRDTVSARIRTRSTPVRSRQASRPDAGRSAKARTTTRHVRRTTRKARTAKKHR